nr:nuclear transport factor 2 family protein [Hongsoonwoonella zoysiae]
MTSEESNVAILKAAYSRWHETKGGSIEHWLGLLDDNVNFGSLAEGMRPLDFTRHRNAKSEVEDYLRSLIGQFDMIHYTIDEYVAQNDRIVAIGSTAWRNKATGKVVETPKIDLFKMKNGKIVEFFEMYDTARVLAACEPECG